MLFQRTLLYSWQLGFCQAPRIKGLGIQSIDSVSSEAMYSELWQFEFLFVAFLFFFPCCCLLVCECNFGWLVPHIQLFLQLSEIYIHAAKNWLSFVTLLTKVVESFKTSVLSVMGSRAFALIVDSSSTTTLNSFLGLLVSWPQNMQTLLVWSVWLLLQVCRLLYCLTLGGPRYFFCLQ